MLTEKQVEAYKRDGYLRVEGLFTQEEVKELNSEMNLIIEDWWGEESIGWRGPWRDHYLPEAERKKPRRSLLQIHTSTQPLGAKLSFTKVSSDLFRR